MGVLLTFEEEKEIHDEIAALHEDDRARRLIDALTNCMNGLARDEDASKAEMFVAMYAAFNNLR